MSSTNNEIEDSLTVSTADMESNPRNASDGSQKLATFDSPVSITVTSYRKHKHDTDGMSIKAVLDGLVHAGILSDDSSKQVKQVTFKSFTAKDRTEWTEIEIDDE